MTSQCAKPKTVAAAKAERSAQIRCGAFIVIIMTILIALVADLAQAQPDNFPWLVFAFPVTFWFLGAALLLTAPGRYKTLLAEAQAATERRIARAGGL